MMQPKYIREGGAKPVDCGYASPTAAPSARPWDEVYIDAHQEEKKRKRARSRRRRRLSKDS